MSEITKPVIGQYFYIADEGSRTWAVKFRSDIPFDRLTRLYIAFAWIRNGLLTYNDMSNTPTDQQRIAALVGVCRQKNPTAQIYISSGYDDNGSMYKQAANNPSAFANSVVKFLRDNALDGYDMDWENGLDRDKLNALLTAVHNALIAAGKADGKTYGLTLAVWPSVQAAYDIGTIGKTVDAINIMSYGKDRSLPGCVKSYADDGFPNAKMIGGIETEADYREEGGVDTLGTGGTIAQKAGYAWQNGLAGMMAWRLDNDYVVKDPSTGKYTGPSTYEGAIQLFDSMPNPVFLAWTGTDSKLNVATLTVSNGLCNKVTISETSTLAPGVAVFNNQLFMAWTGTDNALNVLASSDGTTWNPGNKVTISQTSKHCPALAAFNNALYLAWTGTDGQLNLLPSSDGKTWNNNAKVIISGQSSPAAPTLAVYKNMLYLGWQGTDNKLNVLASSDGRTWDPTKKITIPNESTGMAPVLVVFNNMLYLCWVGYGNSLINFLSSSDGVTFGNKYTLPSETTRATPALAVFNNQIYLAWTGTNNALNVLSGTDVTSLGNKVTLSETSKVGPAIIGFSPS